MSLDLVKQHIWTVPNFPTEGILYRDITPLLSHPQALRYTLDQLVLFAPQNVSHVAAIESRGFLFGVALAMALNVGFVPIRKPNKLPRPTVDAHYTLEYGQDSLSMHADALNHKDHVYLIDDLIATGGTLTAAKNLIQNCGACVAAIACVIELSDLNGRAALGESHFNALVQF